MIAPHSTTRVRTTHVGSLIRPAELLQFIRPKQAGQPYDEQAYAKCLRASVEAAVRRQVDAGIDVVSDGEFGKSISWSQYALERLSGFERRAARPGEHGFNRGADRARFAEFYRELDAAEGPPAAVGASAGVAVCVGPISYTGLAELRRDIENFKSALGQAGAQRGFLPVASPTSVIPDRRNEYYKSDEELLHAIADAMRAEYRAIVDAGLELQLDDARLAVTYDRMVPPASFADYRNWVAMNVEAINHALAGIPEERVRYHVCWGSWPGPHVTDVPFKDIVDLVLKVKAGTYLIEGANPRHEHEWRVWESVKLPEGKVLAPGMISHATNVVEHPELVAQRIVRLAHLVGRDRVLASTDCGFAQGPFHRRVHPTIMWAKLEALAEGARIASKALF
ncbi:MAG TPA: cobalamin-independent methionine synthase II family protein [Burkholderiales bacterium]|jgi:5-methyltetrahydropteroyltriglutamate--homocysteine methyltransferase|nr:cobalamin-independent methionine synthase II family protein [Burkholderiales bacterium]